MSATLSMVFPDLRKMKDFIKWMKEHGEEYYHDDMEDNCIGRVNVFRYLPDHHMIYTQTTEDCDMV